MPAGKPAGSAGMPPAPAPGAAAPPACITAIREKANKGLKRCAYATGGGAQALLGLGERVHVVDVAGVERHGLAVLLYRLLVLAQ